jgi:hypothetical protein
MFSKFISEPNASPSRAGILILLSLFSIMPAAQAQNSAQLQTVSESRYWHLLLHYRDRFWGGVKGESDDSGFFLSPEGRKNPLLEIQAELKAFARTDLLVSPRQIPAQCAFPERYRFLKKELQLTLPDQDCPSFKRWKQAVDPHSVTFIFASAYLNNPTSMFGHTFIRIDSGPETLWGNGVNFGVPQNQSMVSTVVFGLIGGFDGYFSMLPYFQMVNEYNDSESRDLWEYQLNLTAEQVDHLTNHLWELLATNFPYYFFSKNCTTQVLALLDVANPDWYLLDHFYYQVIPADAVRLLAQTPGAVKEVSFRASLDRKLKAKMNRFTLHDQNQFDQAVQRDFTVTGKESPLVLDALIDFQDYRITKEKRIRNEEETTKRREILLARSDSKSPVSDIQVKVPSDHPEDGTPSAKISLYGGNQGDLKNFGLDLRPALHDLMDDDRGYAPNSKVVFGEINLRYLESDHSIHLHQFDVIDVVSLSPISPLNHSLSWAAGIGEHSPEDIFCQECIAGRGYLAGGYSFRLGPDEFSSPVFYSLLKANLEYGEVFLHSFRTGPSLEMGILEALPAQIKIGTNGEFFYFPNQDPALQAFAKWGALLSWQPHFLAKNLELRIKAGEVLKPYRTFFENQATLSLYF